MTQHYDVIVTYDDGEDWDKIAHAIQGQLRYHVAGPWKTANDAFVAVRDAPVAGHMPVYILDKSDVDGALGYHDVDPTNPTLPIGKVFAGTDKQYGLSASVTASHEIMEMAGDLWCLASMQCNPANPAEFWAQELGDPVEADADGYEYQGVLLSDFVYPAYFVGTGAASDGRYDYAQRLTKPRTLRPGGYQAYWNGRTWTQRTAQSEPGVTSRAFTMHRNRTRRELIQWVEALAADGGPSIPN